MERIMESRKVRTIHKAGICVAVLAMLGTILSLSTTSFAQTESVLYSFTGGDDGYSPASSLIFDAAGNLYGTTTFGGPPNTRYCGGNGCGVVFQLSPNGTGGWTYSVIYAFTGAGDGAEPYAGLTLDALGNLYGTASIGGPSSACTGGCGVAFKLAPNGSSGWAYAVIHGFRNTDGASPQASMVFDSSGHLYGTTYYGGTSGYGVAFRLSPHGTGWTEMVLHSFTIGTDGGWPNSVVIDAASGILYGTTYLGGTHGHCLTSGCGVVFKVFRAGGSWREHTIYSFIGSTDGANPGGIAEDGSGNLYITAANGGDRTCNTYGCGTVFKLSPSSSGWSRSSLYAFKGGNDGAFTFAGPTLDSAGNVYGTTANGGSAGTGTLFKVSPSGGGWSETTLYSFTNGAGGGYPRSGVVLDALGNIYGETNSGGIPGDCSSFLGCGVVYEVTP
jgi:uncharacterized repeat protein (TIGR03803 family)